MYIHTDWYVVPSAGSCHTPKPSTGSSTPFARVTAAAVLPRRRLHGYLA